MFSSLAHQLERARLIGGTDRLPVESSENSPKPEANLALEGFFAKWNLFRLEACAAAGIPLAKFNVFLMLGGAAVVGFVAAASLFGNPFLLIPAVLSTAALPLWIRRKIFRRAEAFERDYPTLLISLASAVRTGLDPVVALSQSDVLFSGESEITKALIKFKQNLELGMNEEKAISLFAIDVQHPDLQLFRSAFKLARKHGSSIGECLYRLTKVTRQRQSFRRKMRAAIAMQKLSAFGIFGCAITIALIQYLSNPKALNAALQHPVGFKLLLLGLGLIAAGLSWMLFMVRSKL